ncbi:MAG: hypothetical protein QM793_08600 [Muricomes sp.]
MIDVEYTLKFIHDTSPELLETGRITEGLVHMLSSGFFTGIFETVAHDMDKKCAQEQVGKMQRFYQVGWKSLMAGGGHVEKL